MQQLSRFVRHELRRLLGDRTGAALATFAVAFPVMAGAVGIGLEVGLWYTSRRQAQTSADAAAISGAFERARGNVSGITAAALKEAQRNGFNNAAPATFVVNNPPTSGGATGDASAVEVRLTRQENLLLSSLFLEGSVTIAARSVAQVQITGEACVLALDPSAQAAVTNSGNPTINMAGCVVAANSNDPAAINIAGSSILNAESLWTAGNYEIDGGATLSLATPATTNAWALPDPYADLTLPAIGGCTQTNASYSNTTTTISPGVYCNGLDFGANANVTLQPGTYYINAGDFKVNAQARLRCNCSNPGDGVTIVLTSTGAASTIGTVTINGGADIVLNAPTAEAYPLPGLLFYQDPRAPTNGVNKLNGGSSMILDGANYFPKQLVQWAGTNDTTTPHCVQIVARLVVFTGNSVLDNSHCQEAGVNPVQITGVRVVE